MEHPPEHADRGAVAVREPAREQARQAPDAHVEQVGVAAVGEARGDPVLHGDRPRGEVAAEAQADEGDPSWVDVGPGERMIDDRRDDGLPVRPEGDAAVDDQPTLAGTLEGEDVVPAGERRRGVEEVELLDAAVVAGGQDDGGAPRTVVGRTEEVSGQRSALVGDVEDLGGQVEQRGAAPEALDLTTVRFDQARRHGRLGKEQAGGAEVVRGAEVGAARARPVAGLLARAGRSMGALRGPKPLVVQRPPSTLWMICGGQAPPAFAPP